MFYFIDFKQMLVNNSNLQNNYNNSLVLQNNFKIKSHPFHLLNSSWLPFITAKSAFFVLANLVFYWHYGINLCSFQVSFILISFTTFITVLFYWFASVILESAKYHTLRVSKGLRLGFILFIASEVFFFFCFFLRLFSF